MDFWRAKLTVAAASALYQLNLTFVSAASTGSVAVYWRRGAPPSITRYE